MIYTGDAGTTTGQTVSKRFEAMEAYNKTKKFVINCACFCSATVLTSKIILEIIVNHSEVSGCANRRQKII